MNKTSFYLVIVAIIISTAFIVACQNENTITIVTVSSEVSFSMEGTGYMTIDWSDGTAPEPLLANANAHYNHKYISGGGHTIIIKGKVTSLNCEDNNLISINASKCTALQSLECWKNDLTSLDVSKCTALQRLKCTSNNLISLDVSKCTALQSLECGKNNLTSLDVSKCTALQSLECGKNNLTSLDVRKCTALRSLYCWENNLTSLDVSKCTALLVLNCTSNIFSATALNTLFGTLHSNPIHPIGCSDKPIWISDNPGSTGCNISIAEKKGWRVNN